MKAILALLLAVFVRAAASAAPAAIPPNPAAVWEITEGVEAPESVYYDAATKALYISNVTGGAADKDGTGFITKADLSGKVVAARWARGLNAPKGLAACGGRLYAADIDELVIVALATGEIVKKIPFDGARLLNDLVAGPDCTIYASDTFGGRIYSLAPKGQAKVIAEGSDLQSPNGLFLHKGKLYIAAWGAGVKADWSVDAPGRLLSLDLKTGKVEPVAGPTGNLDGLKRQGEGWFVSDWMKGTVWRVSAAGQTKTLLWGLGGAADLEVAGGLLIVPRMTESRVSAYELSQLPK